MRFVSFLDILGFADLVESTPVQIVIEKIESTLSMVPVAQALGVFPNIPKKPGDFDPAKLPPLSVFSFSDTFVLSSASESAVSFFQTVIGTALLSKYLFAAGLPVRGAITCGEAEYIPGTAHLVGRAIIRAARLEKAQNWFGIIIDPDILTPEREQVLALPLVSPFVVSYDVPFKQMNAIQNPCRVINWRFNIEVQSGTASLLPVGADPAHGIKRDNTLKFCRWLRENNLAYGRLQNASGETVSIPWLSVNFVGPNQPGTPGSQHGDEF